MKITVIATGVTTAVNDTPVGELIRDVNTKHQSSMQKRNEQQFSQNINTANVQPQIPQEQPQSNYPQNNVQGFGEGNYSETSYGGYTGNYGTYQADTSAQSTNQGMGNQRVNTQPVNNQPMNNQSGYVGGYTYGQQPGITPVRPTVRPHGDAKINVPDFLKRKK